MYRLRLREFHLAAALGDIKTVNNFVKKYMYSPTVLFYAAMNNQVEMVDYLISNGYGLHGKGLLELIQQNKKDIIYRIVQKNGLILSAPDVYQQWFTPNDS